MKKIADLSLLICTLNEEYFIPKLLDSLKEQTVWSKEIIVVDARSKDKTIQVIKAHQKYLPPVKIYQIKQSTLAKQRNFAALKARGAALLFLDADMELRDKDSLKKYLKE